jgi:hypothetical protein
MKYAFTEKEQNFSAWIEAHGGAYAVAEKSKIAARTIYSYLKRTNETLSDQTKTKIAKAYGVHESALFSCAALPTVLLIGKITEGSLVMFNYLRGGMATEVTAPECANSQTVGLLVEAGGLGQYFKNWLVFYNDDQASPNESIFEQLCVVKIPTGETLARWVYPGEAGGYVLQSAGEPPIMVDDLVWACPVIDMRPVKK